MSRVVAIVDLSCALRVFLRDLFSSLHKVNILVEQR